MSVSQSDTASWLQLCPTYLNEVPEVGVLVQGLLQTLIPLGEASAIVGVQTQEINVNEVGGEVTGRHEGFLKGLHQFPAVNT